jgi:hypothetical protein
MATPVLSPEEELGFIPDVDDSEQFDFQAELSQEEELGFIPDEPEVPEIKQGALSFEPALIEGTINKSFDVAEKDNFDQVRFTNDVMSMPVEVETEQASIDPSQPPEGEFKEDPIKFLEALKTKAGRPQELVPFVGPMFKISRIARVFEAINRMKVNPEPPKLPIFESESFENLTALADKQVEWMKDRYIVAEWVAELDERQTRGLSIGGKIAEGLLELPAFMIEFLGTSGIFSTVKKGTQATIARVLQRAGAKVSKEFAEKVAKSTGVKLLTATAGVLAGTAARTGAEFTRVLETSLQRITPGIQITEKGEVVLQEAQESPLTALAKGFGSVFIENVTEIAGPTITKAGKAILAKIPILGKLDDAYKTLWLSKNPNKTALDYVKAMGTKVGYDGFIEEIGEEQLGKILRVSTGVDTISKRNEGESAKDYALRLVKSFGEGLLVEAGILAPLALIGGAGKATAARTELNVLRPEQGEPASPEFLQAEERIKLFESEKNVRLSESQSESALKFVESRIGEKTKGKLKKATKAGGVQDDDIVKSVLDKPIDRTSEDAQKEISQSVALVDSLPAKDRNAIETLSIKRVKDRISFVKPKQGIKENLKELAFKADKAFRDEFAGLRRAVRAADPDKKLAPADDPVQLAVAFTQKSSAKTRGFVLEATTDLAGNRKSKSLKEIFTPIVGKGGKKNFEDFVTYLVSARDINLQKQNKETGIDPVASRLTFDALDSPEFAQAAREVTEWNQKGIDLLVESGRITRESGEAIKLANPIYAPFFREFGKAEPVAKGKGKKFVPKRFKGSERKIVDPIEGMIQQMDATIQSAQRAAIERSVANLATANPEALEAFIKPTRAPVKPTKLTAGEIRTELEEIGISFEGVAEADLEELITIFRPSPITAPGVIKLTVDGKDKFFKAEKELLEVLDGTEVYKLGPFWDFVAGKPTRLLKLGATGLNPAFGLIRNPIRDMQTFTVTSEFAKGGPLSAVSGILKDVKTKSSGIAENFGFNSFEKDSDVVKFAALGGEMSGFISQDRQGTKHIQHEMLASNGVRYTINTFKNPIDALRSLIGITEIGTRIGEFSPALKEGERLYGKGSLSASVFALNAAQDVTTNFTRHGQIGKQINQIIPFFNAAIQGPDKLVRSFKARPFKSTVAAVSTLTIPAMFFWWRNKDKPWYQNMTAHEKANYIHYESPNDENTVFRFPVPFELGHVFQAMPVAFLDAVYRENPEEAKKILAATLSTSNPLDWPSLIGPIIDIKANEDFAGRPIVSRANEGKLAKDQFGPQTTELMKAIGKAINMSPSQIEHLTNSYSGGIYNRVSRMIKNNDTEKQPADLPVIGTLFTRDPFAPRRQVEEFYKERELLNKKFNSKDITLPEAFRRIAINNMATVLNVSFDSLKEAKTIEERKAIWSDIGDIVGLVDRLAARED